MTDRDDDKKKKSGESKNKNSVDIYGAESRTNLFWFDPEKLHVYTGKDPKHPLYDPDRVDLPISERMVASIMFKGVIKALKVWKDPEDQKVYVADGRQRRKNAIEANRRLTKQGEDPKHVPAFFTLGKDAQSATDEMVLANSGAILPSVMERARQASRLLANGRTEEQAATLLHMTPGELKGAIMLLEATPALQKFVEDGGSVTLAHKLAKLPADEQKEKVKAMAEASKGETGHKKKKKIREAAGVTGPSLRGKKEINAYREKIDQDTTDPYFRKLTLSLLAWVLGTKKAPPKILKTDGGEEELPETPEPAPRAPKAPTDDSSPLIDKDTKNDLLVRLRKYDATKVEAFLAHFEIKKLSQLHTSQMEAVDAMIDGWDEPSTPSVLAGAPATPPETPPRQSLRRRREPAAPLARGDARSSPRADYQDSQR